MKYDPLEARQKLVDVIEGRISREEASDWASPLMRHYDEDHVVDPEDITDLDVAYLNLLSDFVLAETPADRPGGYLFDVECLVDWLEEFDSVWRKRELLRLPPPDC